MDWGQADGRSGPIWSYSESLGRLIGFLAGTEVSMTSEQRGHSYISLPRPSLCGGHAINVMPQIGHMR